VLLYYGEGFGRELEPLQVLQRQQHRRSRFCAKRISGARALLLVLWPLIQKLDGEAYRNSVLGYFAFVQRLGEGSI
jgi:hypothetical protein